MFGFARVGCCFLMRYRLSGLIVFLGCAAARFPSCALLYCTANNLTLILMNFKRLIFKAWVVSTRFFNLYSSWIQCTFIALSISNQRLIKAMPEWVFFFTIFLQPWIQCISRCTPISCSEFVWLSIKIFQTKQYLVLEEIYKTMHILI